MKHEDGIPKIDKYFTQEEEQTIIDSLNFLATENDCKEHAYRLQESLHKLYNRMHKDCSGSLNNLIGCIYMKVQGQSLPYPLKNYT